MKIVNKPYSFSIFLVLLLISASASAQFWSKKKTDLLPETEAFAMTAFIEGDQLRVQWSIAPDYYMYRDQFGIESNTPGVEFGDSIYPEGTN